ADGLGHPTFNLARSQNGVDDSPNILHRDKVIHASFVGDRVDTYFSTVHGPRISAVSVTAIVVVVPVHVNRLLILAEAFQCSEPPHVFSTGLLKISRSVNRCEQPALLQLLFETEGRGLGKLTDDHAGP